MEKRTAAQDRGLEAAQSLGFTVGSCFCLVLLVVFSQRFAHGEAAGQGPVPSGRVNPNTAPAVSLARLPGIGLARARAIVALRDHLQDRAGRRIAFRTADDMSQVKGIGPATIEGIRPWLQFDPSPGDANEPPVG